ncbi:hypothetical protein EUGRSUZ_K03593 [Eucalyptus grandis]|uniref:Uncharacterized protein n=2 Tax=Eucalyptus grandis TaxID=71139 RepID=A0ACC3J265_EUCGR|nr:hypothetical protein EUGRSUZ_K03593 [Eucalyptus grandis]
MYSLEHKKAFRWRGQSGKQRRKFSYLISIIEDFMVVTTCKITGRHRLPLKANKMMMVCCDSWLIEPPQLPRQGGIKAMYSTRRQSGSVSFRQFEGRNTKLLA